MKRMKKENGVIALEASLVLTLFMFMIMFLYSFFVIYAAQSAINHALIQTAQSMSIDSFSTENLTFDEVPSSTNQILTTIGLNLSINNDKFISDSRWYNNLAEDDWYEEDTSEKKIIEQKNNFHSIVKNRFVAYFTAGGDNALAEKKLKGFNVIDGLNGLDFSESYMDYDSGDLHINVKYKSKFIFNFSSFGINDIQFSESAVSHLWK